VHPMQRWWDTREPGAPITMLMGDRPDAQSHQRQDRSSSRQNYAQWTEKCRRKTSKVWLARPLGWDGYEYRKFKENERSFSSFLLVRVAPVGRLYHMG
jgi:hypothetical protein